MTDSLLKWLNEDIKLSKEITNIPLDFRTGYYFAELLNKMNQLPVLSQYKNSTKKNDIIYNLYNLQKNLSKIGIELDEKSINKIMNSDIYTAQIYLHKIRQLLSNKNINLQQLYFKNSNSLSRMYNDFYFRNNNEKYLNNICRNTINESGINNFKYMRQIDKDKYDQIYNQIKKDYAHLNLNDIDMEFIMTDIKDTERRINYFKNYVYKSEERQKKINQKKSEKEMKVWLNSKKYMDNLKQRIINKSMNKIAQKQRIFNTQMKFNGLYLQKESKMFENKLSLFLDRKELKDKSNEELDEENEEDEEEKRIRQQKISQVILANIKNRLNENLKNKKHKEKRERQKLKEATFDLMKSNLPRKTLNLNIHITDNNNNKKEKNDESEKNLTKTVGSKNSTYSRLTKGDFFTNLIDNSFKIHSGNIKIGNRIHFFKTVINNSNANKSIIIPKIKLPEIIENKEEKEGFNEKEFFEELNKEYFESFNKNFNKKKIKKEKNKNDIKPVIEQIFDVVNYVYDHQKKNKADLIEDKLWKEIGDKFKNNILLNDTEDEEILIKQLEEMKKRQKEEEEKQSFNALSSLDLNLNIFEDLYFDYLNYTGLFNDIIISHKIRIQKYSYLQLYSELYYANMNNMNMVDIKDYEPSEIEIENLSLPKYIKGENEYFKDILTKIIEYKDEDITKLKKELKEENEKIKEDKKKEYIIKNKGKYFYVPIKMVFTGYPCSGRKTQGQLLRDKYPNIKIYDPEEILRNKINEYKELNELSSNISNTNPKLKNMKPAQLEQYKQELEEKKEKFKHILEIIQPYLDILKQKENSQEINSNNINNEKEILSSIYLKLLVEELNKDFNEEEENIIKKLSDNKIIYKKFCEVYEKIEKNKFKLEEIEKELKEINDQKDKLPRKKELTTSQTNILKEQDILNKDLISIKSNLFNGFIIINFPQNKKEALELEKYFTGFELEYKKEENPIIKKLKEYDLINLNLEKNNLNKNFPLTSFFDLFIDFKIDSNEVNQRFQNTKYDPTTGKLYLMEELTKVTDKKLLERLVKGIPNLSEKDFEQKIINYDEEINDISDFYKRMNNGISSVYLNLEQNDNEEKKLLKEVNFNLENAIEQVIIKFFYENIDIIINEIKTKVQNNEEKEKENEKNNHLNNSFTDNNNKIEEESQELQEHMISRNKDESKKQGIYSDYTSSVYKEILTNLDSFHHEYKLSIISLIYLMSTQRKKLLLYLNNVQDKFIKYLNRETESNEIIPMYINKYNNIMKINPKLLKNPKMFEELMEDISSVNNSIWVKVQTKKKEDINHLEKIKNNGEKEKYVNKFMNLALKIYQIEIEKYLINCETVVKYFLNKVGLLSNILGIFQKTNDEFLFKINYKKFLFQNNEKSESSHSNYVYFNTKSDLFNTLSTNETQSSFKEENIYNNIKNIERDLKKLFTNSLKIIIRQEKLNNDYVEKIISVINKEMKDNKSNFKNTNSKDFSIKMNKKNNNNVSSFSVHNNINNSAMTSKSSIFKNKVKSLGNKLLNKAEDISLEDSLKFNLSQEKKNIKYRLMFLNAFIIKYIKLITECFDTVYDNMDEWIIMNLQTQNNKLDEFITYLKRALNQSFDSITMEGREFNYNDKYLKNKKYVFPLYKTIYPDEIINLSMNFTLGDNFQNNLIKLNSLNFSQQYVYNVNDLFDLYNLIKEYGIQSCDYFVKYDIVKNIFINKVINEKGKEYSLFYGNNNANNENKKNNLKENNDNKIFNGVCKIMKFYSNKKIDDFIKIFSVYEDKYININLLFTTLLIIGSGLISSEKFYEQISPFLPNGPEIKDKNKSHILLSLSQFMKINFWFENDQYLNELSDFSEQRYLSGQYNSSCSINQIKDGIQNKIKVADLIFNLLNPRKSSIDAGKSITKMEKKKKINRIKEIIFDINKNNEGYFDINIFGQLLDLLNNYCEKKEKEKNEIDQKKQKENNIDIDENDKCFRFSSDDLDDYNIMNKSNYNKNKKSSESYIINNIFNKIFEN